MNQQGGVTLILGSGPNAIEAVGWDRRRFSQVVAINNAWRVRPDWSHLIHPEDFPPERRPARAGNGRAIVDHAEYVPQQNRYGGVIYAGGTMAFTAGYWALGVLRPRVLAFMGCDMVYPDSGATHFYGRGTADPLRKDVTLQSLEAKAARLWFMASHQGCQCVNLSSSPSRLVFPRARPGDLAALASAPPPATPLPHPPLSLETRLNYFVASGRYWEEADRFDAARLAQVDSLWLEAFNAVSAAVA